MLRKSCRRSMAGYSKGARGLFVLMREIGILTDTAVSPSLRRRQPSSRYAIHAGRNLPDKEFRYLRTVIVTAAVYRGFNSTLSHLLLTFRHRADVRPYTSSSMTSQSPVFLINSRHPHFCAPDSWLPTNRACLSRS